MSRSTWFSRLMITVIAFTLCGGPQLMAAQQAAPAQQTQGDQAQNNQDQQNVGTSQESATPDPSKGPLQPNDTQLPNAPSASQPQPSSSAPDQAQSPQPTETPLGAAAAEAGKVSGGAASRPAGTAIAPAKQHQTRSLLIKIGAIAAGAAALGLVYGLSRGTPSVPPGASTATTTTTSASTANH
jgi:hypothetical protein